MTAKTTWDERAQKVFAHGCLTYSKRADQYVRGVQASHVEKWHGTTLQLTDGKEVVDWAGGLGSNLIDCDNNLSLPTTLEVEVAEMLQKRIPILERMRFLKTGSEACLAAVRIARAYTGRSEVWGYGYHGWGNMFVNEEEPGKGCTDGEYINCDGIDGLLARLTCAKPAAVIVEPVIQDWSPEHRNKLLELRDQCNYYRSVLIFDEVVTGFRWPKYTVAQTWDIEPDLITLGKAAANGYPFAVVGGKAEIMDTEGYFVSSTFAGEYTALLTAMNVLGTVDSDMLEHLWDCGENFQYRFNQIDPVVQLVGYPTRAVWQGTELHKALFMQEMYKVGHLVGKAWSILIKHSADQIEDFMRHAERVLPCIANGEVGLEGELPQPVFKRYEEQ